MLDNPEDLFEKNPDPMWIHDPETLSILDVNESALQIYGYSREDFLGMLISDISPPEDRDRLRAQVKALPAQRSDAGIWRHSLKCGGTIHVEITGQSVRFRGRRAQLVVARDVSRFVAAERERTIQLDEERQARRNGEAEARRYRAFFDAIPGRFLVIAPGTCEILAASDSYLEVFGVARGEMVGRPLFDVFPADAPGDSVGPAADFRASLDRVVDNRVSDTMARRPWHLWSRTRACDTTEIRWWSPVNTPVLNQEDAVAYIMHQIEDVTDLVRASDGGAPGPEVRRRVDLQREIPGRTESMRRAHVRLQAQDAELRAAEQLTGLRFWKMDLETGRIAWSPRTAALYGATRKSFGGDIRAYIDLVHVEDRRRMERTLQTFFDSQDRFLHFEHRVPRDDGRVIHVRGQGERMSVQGRWILSGVVHDISDRIEARDKLILAGRLLEIASKAARVGGWRVELPLRRLLWTPELAALHDMDPDQRPDLEQTLDMYAPVYRARLAAALDACLGDGAAFDEILELVTARGRRLWVRAIGEATRDQDSTIAGAHGAFQDVSEMVEARTRLAHVSQRLLITLEQISDGIIVLDRNGCFTFVNVRAEQMLRRSRDALLGRSLWTEFPETVGGQLQSECLRAMHGRETVRFVARIAPWDMWVRVNVHPVPGDGLAIYFDDVSNEQAGVARLQLLESAVSRLNDMVLITDAKTDAPDGPRILYLNDAFERRTGFSQEEALGKTPRILHGPDTDRQALDRIRAALETGDAVREELINYTRAGEPFWVEVDIAPLRNAAGVVDRFVAIQRDVTERRRAEEALRVSEERFQLIARAAHAVIWDWDVRASTMWWSFAAGETFGGYRAEDDANGVDEWMSRLHPDDRDRVVAGIRAAIRGDASTWADEYRYRHAEGRWLSVVSRGFIMRNEKGRGIRMLGSMADETEQREAAARLRQVKELEVVGQLAAGVAHDFNNLLTVILGSAEMLSGRLAEQPELAILLDMVETAAGRAAEITSRLLAFSRRQPLAPQLTDVNHLLRGIRHLLRRALPANVELDLVCDEGLWSIEVDPNQLEAALLNLVLNSRDAMPGGGRLVIDTVNIRMNETFAARHNDLPPGCYVSICVTDTGDGMSEEVVARAFEPFFTTREVGKGSGLGLSMTYGFVKQSGGDARIFSEPGHGTAIRLYFPRHTGAGRDEVGDEAAEINVGGRERILTVEHDPLVRDDVTAQLASLGYSVTGAGSGPEALEILQDSQPFDLLLTDVAMPGDMTGAQLARAARELCPQIRVLFNSGYVESAIVHNGRFDSEVQLLAKPYRLSHLARKIRDTLDDN